MLYRPSDGEVLTNATVTLVWGASPTGAEYYEIEINTPSTGPVTVITVGTSCTISVSPGQYSWRVRAYLSALGGYSVFTSTWTFTVETQA